MIVRGSTDLVALFSCLGCWDCKLQTYQSSDLYLSSKVEYLKYGATVLVFMVYSLCVVTIVFFWTLTQFSRCFFGQFDAEFKNVVSHKKRAVCTLRVSSSLGFQVLSYIMTVYLLHVEDINLMLSVLVIF